MDKCICCDGYLSRDTAAVGEGVTRATSQLSLIICNKCENDSPLAVSVDAVVRLEM